MSIGKTFLAGTVIDKARTVGRTLFAFLSHVHSSRTSALSVLHSLVFQLARNDEDIQTALFEASRADLENSITVTASLLTMLLKCAGPVYIIIDGVDEIGEVERGRLLRQLLDMSKNCDEMKLMVSCRPEADVKAVLESVSASIRVDSRNAGSIQTFVTRQSHRWFEIQSFLPGVRSEIERLLAPIAAKAKGMPFKIHANYEFQLIRKGMFLYAKILLSSIEFLDDIGSIREELRVLPEDLDAA